jgi:hypothetical protein
LVEALGDVPAQFEVLALVVAHGYEVGLVQQDIRRLQYGVSE